MNRDLLKLLAVLIAISISMAGLAFLYNEERQEFVKGEADYSLSYHYYVENEGPVNLTSLTIRLALLKTWDPVQRVESIDISPIPTRTVTDEYENNFVYYEFDEFLVGQSINISISANLIVNLLDYTSLNLEGTSYDKQSDDYLLYTRFDSLTDPTNPRILNVAQNFDANPDDPLSLAFSAYNFTASYLNYRLLSTSRGASFAISQGYGDCDEFQSLFIALSQAQSVPAVGHTAWFAEFEEGLTFSDQGSVAHAYPMFLAPKYGLLPVDPTRGSTSIFDNWLKKDHKTITMTRGPDHPYRLLNYRWVPDEFLGDPLVTNNYTIYISQLDVTFFSGLRQIILISLIAIPVIFTVYNVVHAIKSKSLRDKKLDQLLSPTYHDNEGDF